MSWKTLLKFLKEWGLVVLLLAPLFVLYNADFSSTQEEFDRYKDIIEVISWIFAGVLSLVTFSTLFIAFTYENKLIVASRNLQSILKPYSISTEDLRHLVINYENSLSEDKILKYIYFFFIIVSFFSILTWGIAVGAYTNFNISFVPDFSLGSLLVFGLYSLYALLYLVLVSLTIAIKLIILNKDPLEKGYLPKSISICDFNYLTENNGDVEEFFVKNPLSVTFYKNPPPQKNIYETVLKLPINISNVRYVIRFYTMDNESLISIFGETKDSLLENETGKAYSKVLTLDDFEVVYNSVTNGKCYAFLKLYDSKYDLKSMYFLEETNKSQHHVEFMVTRSSFIDGLRDNDGNFLKSVEKQTDYSEYQIERISIK